MPDTIPNLHQWERGPKITAIGGGTGLSTMLRGLKKYTKNLTAVVTVADDGGGSGVLRRDIGMPPPGDIRHCMESLANVEPIMERLLTYRFQEGSLAGQSFGNLILAALNGVTGSFEEAVAQMSQVLAITGRILPVTSADVQLEAVFENGARVVGESKISSFKKEQDCRIAHVALLPERPAALQAALQAIREADLILMGPGSLYTSVIPNLLVEGVVEAICRSEALKIYVCNIMTQEGETEGYTAAGPCGRPAVPRGAGAGGPVPGQLGAGASRPGGEVPGRRRRPHPGGPGAHPGHGAGAGGVSGGLGGGRLCPPRPGPAGGGGAGRVPPAGGAHLPGRTAVHH